MTHQRNTGARSEHGLGRASLHPAGGETCRDLPTSSRSPTWRRGFQAGLPEAAAPRPQPVVAPEQQQADRTRLPAGLTEAELLEGYRR